MRVLLFAGALLGLVVCRPLASSSAQPAAPPVAAAALAAVASQEASRPMFESPELFKFAVTQGGLTLVCLVLFWWITREHKKQDAVKDERQQILVNIVEKNTVAVTTMDQTCQRLARSLERPIYTPDGRNAGAGS